MTNKVHFAEAHATIFGFWVAAFGFSMVFNTLANHLSGWRYRNATVNDC